MSKKKSQKTPFIIVIACIIITWIMLRILMKVSFIII